MANITTALINIAKLFATYKRLTTIQSAYESTFDFRYGKPRQFESPASRANLNHNLAIALAPLENVQMLHP